MVCMFSGRLFHSLGPLTLNDLSTNVFLAVVGTLSSCLLLDFRPFLQSSLASSRSHRYFGAIPCLHSKTMVRTLYSILDLMGSKCNCFEQSVALQL